MLEEIKLKEIQEKVLPVERIGVRLPPELSTLQRLRLHLFGEVVIGFTKAPGYQESLPKYLMKCRKHGYFYATPRGYLRKKECIDCLKEQLRNADLI